MIPAYPSIRAVGHRLVADLFNGNVVIQEKVDGSQFSMMRDSDGKLHCRSKGQEIFQDSPEKMFLAAVETAKSLDLIEGCLYRCEYLRSPKHNTLGYSRVPNRHLVLFDFETSPGLYGAPAWVRGEAARLGLETVPVFYAGPGRESVMALGGLESFLERESFLGGVKIEGVVVKNYDRFGADGHVLIGKYVSADFKEKHRHQWKVSNPGKNDFVESLVVSLRTPARWRKTIQHLRDDGKLVSAPEDIGPLLNELKADTTREEAEQIKQVLFEHFMPKIVRGVCAGFPEFYKAELANAAMVAPVPAHV